MRKREDGRRENDGRREVERREEEGGRWRRRRRDDGRGWERLNGGLFERRREEGKEMVGGDRVRGGEKTWPNG